MNKNNSNLYFIAIVLPEPQLSFVENIKKEIAGKFNSQVPLKAPAHITLIPPFSSQRELDLKRLITNYSFEPFTLFINSYGSFSSKCVFLKPNKSEELISLYQNFRKNFKLDFSEVKRKIRYSFYPHITVGNRDWSSVDFQNCWEQYRNSSVNFDFQVEDISLLKHLEGKWDVLPSSQKEGP